MMNRKEGAKVTTFSSQPWWHHGIDHDTDSTKWLDGITMDFSTAKHRDNNGVSKIYGSQNTSLHNETEVHEQVKSNLTSQEFLNEGDKQNQKHSPSSTFSTSIESLAQAFKPDLLDSSIACGSYQQPEPFNSGIMPTYIAQALPHLQGLDLHTSRMVLPLEVAEEPVYVNAKQYHGILRRRQSRAKAELEKKLIRERRPYLHESRHQHAMRRARGCGGRFLSTKKLANSPTSPSNTLESSNGGSRKTNSILQLEPSSSKLDPSMQMRTQFQGFSFSTIWQ